jgi:hypothetical protein
MAYDFALDPATGDFLFGPTRDVIGVTGPELDSQRISIRCKIPRGTFVYDEEGTLGSFLHLIPRNPPSSQLGLAENYVREALEDADGISVEDVSVSADSYGMLNADIKFIQTGSLDGDLDTDFESDLPEFDANVMLGHLE